MAKQAGQVLRMARPAAYWARRAALRRRQGNRQQAEALLRHAVTLTPDDPALMLSHAQVLQEMQRYEASNRQAFAALAVDPDCHECISLVAGNLMALGYLEEAADALAHVLPGDTPAAAEVHAMQLDRLETLLPDPLDCGYRYQLLVQRAADMLAAGELADAEKLLHRACAMPRRDERCHTLLSLLYGEQGNEAGAIAQAEAACRLTPRSARAHCALAELYTAGGQHGKARKALFRAAGRALTAEDERLVCHTALSLRLPAAALPMLARGGQRVHSLFNTAVLCLASGQAQRALRALEACHTLDPDDVPTRYLRRTAQALSVLPRKEAARYAAELRLYPALSDADNMACNRDFMQAMEQGIDVFARRLQAEPALQRLTLYQAETPHTDIAGLLEQGFAACSENFTVKLLRKMLLLPGGGASEKQLAIRMLLSDRALPFVLWHGGRLSFIHPHAGGESAQERRLKDILLRGRSAGCSAAVLTHAMRLIRHMPPRARLKIASAQGGAFLRAAQLHRSLPQTDVPPAQSFHSRHERRLYRMLLRTAPPGAGSNPGLWRPNAGRRSHETD